MNTYKKAKQNKESPGLLGYFLGSRKREKKEKEKEEERKGDLIREKRVLLSVSFNC